MSYFGSSKYRSEFDPEGVALEAELALLQDMSLAERQLHLAIADHQAERRELDRLMDDYRYMGIQITKVKSLAKLALLDYNEDEDDEALERVELYAEMAHNFSRYRQQLREDIKQTRERVRWLKQKTTQRS